MSTATRKHNRTYNHLKSTSVKTLKRIMSTKLSETVIQDSFHSYLKSSLSQAKSEGLLDADILSSAEGDLMITGPALCLYFAALRCTTHPPSVPLPRSTLKESSGKQPTTTIMELSYENCPPSFISFLRTWANTVPSIQSLVPEVQHDLARVICGLQPLEGRRSSRVVGVINGIAADLRAVAIEISQRRSFQDRYASDLQAALDAGAAPGGGGFKKASFVPPPVYDASPRSSMESLRPKNVQAPHLLSPSTPPPPTSPSVSSSRSPSPSHSLFNQDSPSIEFIRETLYASLADVLERQSSLRRLLKRDPPRAYFASVAFAILDVSTNAIAPDGSIIGILGKRLTKQECPHELLPFMKELSAIGQQAKLMEQEDNMNAITLVQQGKDIPLSRLDRVRLVLEKGAGYEHKKVVVVDDDDDDDNDDNDGRRSVEGRAVAFANKVNALGLALTKLKPFKERQEYVFTILGGIGS